MPNEGKHTPEINGLTPGNQGENKFGQKVEIGITKHGFDRMCELIAKNNKLLAENQRLRKVVKILVKSLGIISEWPGVKEAIKAGEEILK